MIKLKIDRWHAIALAAEEERVRLEAINAELVKALEQYVNPKTGLVSLTDVRDKARAALAKARKEG